MKEILRRLTALVVAIVPAMTQLIAHPGHGQEEGVPAHYFTSPVHVIPIVTALVLIVVLMLSWKRAGAKR